MARTNGAVKTKAKPLHPGAYFDARVEWAAMKGRCRNLTPAAAVRECGHLSEEYRRMFRMPEISWQKIAAALQAKKIPFVLTGAYGIAAWTGRPRSTHDVDILVKAGRNHARAVKVIEALYPELEKHLVFGVTAFFVKGERESVIDVTYPHRADNAETLKTALWFDVEGVRVRIPRLEEALANKYGAMLALNRDPIKRAQDGVDFATMVKHSQDEGRDTIKLERLAELGELVWPGGGGKEIIEVVEQCKTGKVPNLTARD